MEKRTTWRILRSGWRDGRMGAGASAWSPAIIGDPVSGIEKAADRSGLTGVAMMARQLEHLTSKKITKEIARFILSKEAATANELAATIQDHWHIETTPHWSLDVTPSAKTRIASSTAPRSGRDYEVLRTAWSKKRPATA